MYYNSNRNSDEYYSSYRKELSAVRSDSRNKSSLSLAIKRVGIAVLLLALLFASFYLIKYFSANKKDFFTSETINTKNSSSHNNNNLVKNSAVREKIPKIILLEEKLPKSIQLKNSESKIISNLKENATDSLAQGSPLKSKEYNEIQKEVITLKETSNMNADDIEHIVNLVLSKQKDKCKSHLEEELLRADSKESQTLKLKESNHYNKVSLPSKKTDSNNKFTKSHNKTKLSNYEKSLKPEIATRSNAMRIIIVEKGDTLSSIAFKAYGNRESYSKILKANPEIIRNPNHIFVGQKIRIPR